MKGIALILCAFAALGVGAVAYAQGTPKAQGASAAGVVGTAQAVDETALAIEDTAATPPTGTIPAGSNTLVYFIRMIVVLALVLGAVYLVVRLMKRLSRPKAGDDSAIKVLASTALGAGRALHVVALGTKAYLIGASESSVTLISEVDDKEYLDALALKEASAPKGGGFGELLGSMLGGKGGKKASGRSGRAEFLAGQRERLRKF